MRVSRYQFLPVLMNIGGQQINFQVAIDKYYFEAPGLNKFKANSIFRGCKYVMLNYGAVIITRVFKAYNNHSEFVDESEIPYLRSAGFVEMHIYGMDDNGPFEMDTSGYSTTAKRDGSRVYSKPGDGILITRAIEQFLKIEKIL